MSFSKTFNLRFKMFSCTIYWFPSSCVVDDRFHPIKLLSEFWYTENDTTLGSRYPYYRFRGRLIYPYFKSTDKLISMDSESVRMVNHIRRVPIRVLALIVLSLLLILRSTHSSVLLSTDKWISTDSRSVLIVFRVRGVPLMALVRIPGP